MRPRLLLYYPYSAALQLFLDDLSVLEDRGFSVPMNEKCNFEWNVLSSQAAIHNSQPSWSSWMVSCEVRRLRTDWLTKRLTCLEECGAIYCVFSKNIIHDHIRICFVLFNPYPRSRLRHICGTFCNSHFICGIYLLIYNKKSCQLIQKLSWVEIGSGESWSHF